MNIKTLFSILVLLFCTFLVEATQLVSVQNENGKGVYAYPIPNDNIAPDGFLYNDSIIIYIGSVGGSGWSKCCAFGDDKIFYTREGRLMYCSMEQCSAINAPKSIQSSIEEGNKWLKSLYRWNTLLADSRKEGILSDKTQVMLLWIMGGLSILLLIILCLYCSVKKVKHFCKVHPAPIALLTIVISGLFVADYVLSGQEMLNYFSIGENKWYFAIGADIAFVSATILLLGSFCMNTKLLTKRVNLWGWFILVVSIVVGYFVSEANYHCLVTTALLSGLAQVCFMAYQVVMCRKRGVSLINVIVYLLMYITGTMALLFANLMILVGLVFIVGVVIILRIVFKIGLSDLYHFAEGTTMSMEIKDVYGSIISGAGNGIDTFKSKDGVNYFRDLDGNWRVK